MRYLVIVFAAGLAALSCEGLLPGPNDFEPTGTDFRLNDNLAIIAISGKDQGFPTTGVYPVNLRLVSRTQNQVADTLPAGLLFRSAKRRVQHLLCLKPHTVAAGSAAQDIMVGAFCCNKYRAIPRSSDTFTLGPVTDNSELQEIVGLVRNKNISGHLWMVQRAVWMVTDSTGLNQVYRDSLAALPDAERTDRPGIEKGRRAAMKPAEVMSEE